jgi:hypothetical protein
MINVDYIKCPYVISSFDSHLRFKKELLQIIDAYDSEYNSISKTDWKLDKSVSRPYWNLIYEDLKSHMINVFKELKYEGFEFCNFWFQQYKKNDNHTWHVHGGVNWTNVYYVELPNKETSTNIINPSDESIFVPNVYEGCILTMPSILYHSSPINTTDSNKTVIVFNINTP